MTSELLSSWPAPVLYLDAPAIGDASKEPLHVSGWLGGNSAIRDLSIKGMVDPSVGTTRVCEGAVNHHTRTDVEQAFPGLRHVSGFSTSIDHTAVPLASIAIEFTFGDRRCRYVRSLTGAIDPAVKTRKLNRIRPLIASNLAVAERPTCLDLLSAASSAAAGLAATDSVSSNAYDGIALGLFSYFSDGLILDAGAGFNPDYQPHVVNLEVVPYPTCDVLAIGERLPFKDESFDAVLSLAVLEHVRDPFACAKEIQRVLKPGGLLYAVVPFLQPYHGYPHHYYNMSHQGLGNLFSGLRVVTQRVPLSGLPIWPLCWYIQAYCRNLPPAERERFASMRIGDFLTSPATFLNADVVSRMSPAGNFELASTTMLLAIK